MDSMAETRSPSLSRRGLLLRGATTLAAAGLGTALAGCGRSGSDRSGPLQFWNFYAPAPNRDPNVVARAEWFERTVAGWNAENEQQIELVYVPVLGSQKLAVSFAAGRGPDIFLISPGDIIRYANGGVLQELTPHMTRDAIDDFFPDNMASRVVGDKVYALPMEIEPLAMFYSRPAFEKAGLSEGDIPKTWDDLFDVGDKLRTAGQGSLVFETNQGYYQNFVWYPWMWQGGGDVISADGKRSTFDSKATVQALQFWRDAIDSEIAPRVLPASGDLISAFGEGYASIWHTGIWTVSDFAKRAPDFDYGVFPMPIPPGGKPATDLGGWAFVANSMGKNPEAAAKFCVWALGTMEQESIERVGDWCVKTKSDIAPRKSSLEYATSIDGYASGPMKTFKEDIFPTGRGEPRYPPVVYKSISDAIQSSMLAGGDPAEQANIASRAVDAYLQTYEGAKIL